MSLLLLVYRINAVECYVPLATVTIPHFRKIYKCKFIHFSLHICQKICYTYYNCLAPKSLACSCLERSCQAATREALRR